MDETRKRSTSTVNAKNMSSSLDDDFGNDFLSSWKLPKSGKDTLDFDVDSVPKSSKKFSFENLDDFGLDGAFDKLSSFKMSMSDLDFSCPLKKAKHSNLNGNDLLEGKKETEKDNFSFSFDFNELGKFNLDAKLGIEENGTNRFAEKADTMSSEGKKDPQGDLSSKGTDTPEGKKSKEETQMQDACTLRPTHLTRHGDHSNEKYPTKAAVNKSSQNVLCGAVSGEDPTHSSATAVPENSKEAPSVDLSKINVSKENNDSGLSVSSQSRNTVAVNPYISRGLVGHSNSPSDQNEVVEESASLNEGSHGTQCLRGTSMNLPKKASFGTKNVEEGTSGLKNLSSLMQRENRNAKPELVNETGSFSLLSKSANMEASRPPELNPDITLNQLNGANIKKRNAHPIDLKREQKCARPEKSEIALEKTYCKTALHVPSTTSLNAKLDIEALSTGNCNLSVPNAPSSTGHGIFPGQALLKSSIASDNIQDTPSKDGQIPAISQLTGTTRIAKVGGRNPKSGLLPEKESEEVSGRKCAPVTKSKIPNSFLEQKSALLSPSMKQKMPEESVPDLKSPAVLKRIIRSPLSRQSPKTMPESGNQTILGSGTPKARMDNKVISSAMPYDMGDISDLELPSLLENDGNVEKAEACRKQLEDICILLKRKHGEAKELAVRAVVMNNMMLMLNHPMIEEKICALQKFANSLKSKTYLFEEISTIDAH